MGITIVSLLVNLVSWKKVFLPTQRQTMHVTSLPCFIFCPFFIWRIIMLRKYILLSRTPPYWESKCPVIPLLTNNPSTLILLVVLTRNCVISSSTTFLSRLSSIIGTPSLLKWLLHLMRRWLRQMLCLPSNATRWYLYLCASHSTPTCILFSGKYIQCLYNFTYVISYVRPFCVNSYRISFHTIQLMLFRIYMFWTLFSFFQWEWYVGMGCSIY